MNGESPRGHRPDHKWLSLFALPARELRDGAHASRKWLGHIVLGEGFTLLLVTDGLSYLPPLTPFFTAPPLTVVFDVFDFCPLGLCLAWGLLVCGVGVRAARP